MDDNRLTEVLNIEISQGVITSVTDAVNWVKGTFLYRRIQSHPLFYGCNGSGDDVLHSFVLGKCSDSIDKLRKIRAIDMHDDDATFSPTPGCHVMSRNFIDFETMKDIIKLPHNSGPVQLLHMISNCSKIQTPVRRHEKKALNEAYKRIKYKLEGCVSSEHNSVGISMWKLHVLTHSRLYIPYAGLKAKSVSRHPQRSRL